jgi:hypothetical protein
MEVLTFDLQNRPAPLPKPRKRIKIKMVAHA